MLKSRFLNSVTAMLLACSLRAEAASDYAENETLTANDTSTKVSSTAESNNATDANNEGVDTITADSIQVEGDKLELHLDRKMRALGNASITRGKQKILGDVIDYDVQNDALQVTGNAKIKVGNANLAGSALHMQLSENIGEMQNASISLFKSASAGLIQPITSSETFSKRLGNLQSQQIGGDDANVSPDTVQGLDANSTKARGDAKVIFFDGQDKKRLKDARYTTCAAGGG